MKFMRNLFLCGLTLSSIVVLIYEARPDKNLFLKMRSDHEKKCYESHVYESVDDTSEYIALYLKNNYFSI